MAGKSGQALEHLAGSGELSTLEIDTMENYRSLRYFRQDASRLVLDISNLGLTGFEGEEVLRRASYKVEMSDFRSFGSVCTVADRKEDFHKLVEACRLLSQEKRKYKGKTKKLTISREIPLQMLSPKEAFEREKELIPLKEARGRICGELVGAYPPGIPRFCPGELIDSEGI